MHHGFSCESLFVLVELYFDLVYLFIYLFIIVMTLQSFIDHLFPLVIASFCFVC